jgi:hypothetical protein
MLHTNDLQIICSFFAAAKLYTVANSQLQLTVEIRVEKAVDET